MINELTVLNALQNVLISNVNQYLDEDWTQLSSSNVIMDFPSVDLMPSDITVFIVPDNAEYELLATTNDQSTFNIMVMVLCKRDTQSNLMTKTYTYFNGIYEALRKSMSLGGVVDFVEISSSNFYPAIEMNKNVVGIEISVAIQYTKDF